MDCYALNSSRKIVEQARFTPTQMLNPVTDWKIQKKLSFQFDTAEMVPVVEAIVQSINGVREMAKP